jgi:hypothetical protein
MGEMGEKVEQAKIEIISLEGNLWEILNQHSLIKERR